MARRSLLLGLATALLVGAAGPSVAQLVMVHDNYVVSEVRPASNEIIVVPSAATTDDNSDLRSRFVVLIGPRTVVVDPTGRPVNWRTFKPGSTIHVDGGLKVNVKIQADKIVATSP